MQNSDNDIDQSFGNKLADYEVTPPAVVWDKISESMGYSHRKRRMVWWWTMAGAASLVFAFIAGWYLSNQSFDSEQLYTDMASVKNSNSQKNILESHVEQNLQIHFDKPHFQPLLTVDGESDENLKFSEKIGAASHSSTLNNSETTTSAEIWETSVIGFMKSKVPGVLDPNSFSEKLVKTQADEISEFDRMMIENNLLAMNAESNSTSHKGSWAVGVQASPVSRFDQIATDNADYLSISGIQNSVSTSYKTSVSGGFSVSYETENKLAFITGVNYNEVAQNSGDVGVSFSGHNWFTQRGEESSIDYATADLESNSISASNVILNTQVGLANIALPEGVQLAETVSLNSFAPEVVQNYDFIQTAGYVEIPLLMRYSIIDKRIGVHFVGGVNTNLLVSNNANLVDQGELIASGKIEDLRSITFSSSLGMGMKYHISRRISLNVEPTLKILLNSLNTQANFDSRPYAFGVYSGISYQF